MPRRSIIRSISASPGPGQKGEQKLLPILHMFPGKLKTVIYYADTGVRRGGTCAPQEVMLQELRELLGEKNVVLK